MKDIVKLIAGENKEVANFLATWHKLVDDIDNIVDGDVDQNPIDRARIITNLCNFLYCPYFVRHAIQFWPIMSKILADYQISIENENISEPKNYFFYDSLRQSYIDLTLVVAHLECSFEVMLEVNRKLRSLAYDHDH